MRKAIEKHVGDSLKKAKELKAYVESGKWSGKTRDAFLSYLELIIELNADMKDALKDHTAALDALQNARETIFQSSVKCRKSKT
jgi:hypothetical protein